MSQTTTLVLLPQTTWNGNVSNVQIYDVVGVRNPAASYYVGSKDLQTINVNQVGLTGNIIVQATLATLPETTDWFEVYKLEANAGAPANTTPNFNSSINEAVNIEGNFVWMRAIIQDFNGGILQYVKLSY
jgi:hypothetical protein